MRVQIGIDEVLEVGQTVFRGHFEKGLNVFALPIEVGSDVVGRDGEGEDATIGVSPGHDLDEGAVNKVHFLLELTVGEINDLIANQRVLIDQIIGAGPVESEVGEGALASPTRRHVEVVDQFLHALKDLVVGHIVQTNERRHVGIEGGEGLGAGPFVLKRAEEVHDLAAGGREVLGGCRGDRATDPVEALLNEALERPSCAVASEHIEVVDVNVTVAVCHTRFGRVDALQPVVRNHLSGGVEDQTTQ